MLREKKWRVRQKAGGKERERAGLLLTETPVSAREPLRVHVHIMAIVSKS